MPWKCTPLALTAYIHHSPTPFAFLRLFDSSVSGFDYHDTELVKEAFFSSLAWYQNDNVGFFSSPFGSLAVF